MELHWFQASYLLSRNNFQHLGILSQLQKTIEAICQISNFFKGTYCLDNWLNLQIQLYE